MNDKFWNHKLIYKKFKEWEKYHCWQFFLIMYFKLDIEEKVKALKFLILYFSDSFLINFRNYVYKLSFVKINVQGQS